MNSIYLNQVLIKHYKYFYLCGFTCLDFYKKIYIVRKRIEIDHTCLCAFTRIIQRNVDLLPFWIFGWQLCIC